MTLNYPFIWVFYRPRPGQYCACKCRSISTVTPNLNQQKKVVIINTLGLITKKIYYLEHKIEKLTLIDFPCCCLWAKAGQFCACKCRSMSTITPTRNHTGWKKKSVSTCEVILVTSVKMMNKYVILPEINLPLRNSLLTNTREGGKVLSGIRYPNRVRIQKVPRSLSRKRVL